MQCCWLTARRRRIFIRSIEYTFSSEDVRCCWWKRNLWNRSTASGYNGGGRSDDRYHGAGSGGGATDFRVLKNTLYHRILVAGGGGGSDNGGSPFLDGDDGSGGAGGLPSQGYWGNRKYFKEAECNSTYGFTFGQGQRGGDWVSCELAGAGGGFFGGFTIKDSNSGAGGGSSFALSDDVPIPKGYIIANDENGTFLSKAKYAFDKNSVFKLRDVNFATGIWKENGMARITLLEPYADEKYLPKRKCSTSRKQFSLSIYLIILITSK